MRLRNFDESGGRQYYDFAKWTRGMDIVKDAVLILEKFKKSQYSSTYTDKDSILRALEDQDKEFLRGLSLYYYNTSGIYARFVKYLAGIPTYDWYIYPAYLKTGYNKKQVEKILDNITIFLDELYLKKVLYNIGLTIILNGVYYGYCIIDKNNIGTIMDLPVKYCRSRYTFNGIPAVEFNVKYFDEEFTDKVSRDLVLKNMPKEFKTNYEAYKTGKIPLDRNDQGAWFLCDMDLSMRFTLGTNEIPIFAAVIPAILDLEEAKQLDMKKTMQELLKILIQKMPLDKNNEMVFDLDEAKEMHNNLCKMLQNAVSVDVLTTFGDVEAIDLDNSTATTEDPLSKVERGVFNEAGISQMLFATDGNLSLEKSIMNDESLMFTLLPQIEQKLNNIIEIINKTKIKIKISFPTHSIYNKKDLTKTYKEMANSGYSKLMPAIAMGLSQSEFIAINEYENNILDLNNKMNPLQISSTQSNKNSNKTEEKTTTTIKEEKQVGAPEKDDSEKSEKTIQNKESMS